MPTCFNDEDIDQLFGESVMCCVLSIS